MIREAFSYLVDLGRKESEGVIVKSRNGTEYWANKKSLVENFKPDVVKLCTLQGLVDFINSEDLGDKQIFIENRSRVFLMDFPANPTLVRHRLASVAWYNANFPFDQYHHVSIFIESCQRYMVIDDEFSAIKVLQIVSNLQAEAVHTNHDDGITQKVAVSQGVKAANYVNFENPVKLRFFDTFPDLGIGLPRTCNLRFRTSDGNIPTVGLFLAGDPEWEIACRKRIRDWLAQRIKNPIIL